MKHLFLTISLCLVAGAIMSGCGTINVSVDVLDPRYVHQQVDAVAESQAFAELQKARPGDVAKRVDASFDAFAREILSMSATMQKIAASLPSGAQQKAIADAAAMLKLDVGSTSRFRREADNTGIQLESLVQQLRDEAVSSHYVGNGELPINVRTLVMAFQAKDKALSTPQVNYVRLVQEDLRRNLADTSKRSDGAAPLIALPADANVQTLAAQASAAIAAASRSIIGDGSLAATEFAYFVASAPDTAWQTDFNRAYADTRFGNADVVIRLNSTADFSVKGLQFDASKVAQVASKIVTQTVLLSAQIAGVPVPAASLGGSGDALSKSSAELAGINATQGARDARQAGQKAAIRSLARSLLMATPELTDAALAAKDDKDPGRLAVHGSINSSYLALKSLMSLQDMQ